jgi:hypothetical protein
MQKIDFNLHFVVPISHKIIPLHVVYGQEIIFEHLVMPWETGIAKQINFATTLNVDSVNVSRLKIINSFNQMPVTLEVVKINNEVQNMSPQGQKVQNYKKQIYLDTFLKACDLDATVLKIMGLPNTVSISHSYLCNGNVYVPKCDRYNSIISFNDSDTDTLKFVVEFFETNLTQCLCHIECSFNNGVIETRIKQNYQRNINELHENLKNHYEEICAEEFIQDTNQTQHVNKILTFPTIEQKISHHDVSLQDISAYSVIKFEGLPNNIDIHKNDIFYQNGAYYLSNTHKKSYHYLLSHALNCDGVIISYYHDNSFEPVLKNILFHDIHSDTMQKTG